MCPFKVDMGIGLCYLLASEGKETTPGVMSCLCHARALEEEVAIAKIRVASLNGLHFQIFLPNACFS